MKKDKTIGIKTNKVERERIEYLCNKMDMNMSQLVIYLIDSKYISYYILLKVTHTLFEYSNLIFIFV